MSNLHIFFGFILSHMTSTIKCNHFGGVPGDSRMEIHFLNVIDRADRNNCHIVTIFTFRSYGAAIVQHVEESRSF